MKIISDLRQAIRAVIEERNSKVSSQSGYEGKRKAIKVLLALPKYSARHKSAQRDIAKAEELRGRARKFYESVGLYSPEGIDDEIAFCKAGGKLEFPAKLSFTSIMARLAGANEIEGQKILSELGVKWS